VTRPTFQQSAKNAKCVETARYSEQKIVASAVLTGDRAFSEPVSTHLLLE